MASFTLHAVNDETEFRQAAAAVAAASSSTSSRSRSSDVSLVRQRRSAAVMTM